ncbi:MAG: response regulator [Myxococcales bacterium]|nr:response regulator [Myxococcales bacterium]
MAKILVVDDELDVVRMVVRTLEARGHSVDVARDGEAALALIALSAPDLLVVDANLPRIDGVEVCRRLRADPATRAMPIVMMSAAYVSLADALTDGGADELVMKPFVRETLVNNVERLLKPRP